MKLSYAFSSILSSLSKYYDTNYTKAIELEKISICVIFHNATIFSSLGYNYCINFCKFLNKLTAYIILYAKNMVIGKNT